MWKLGPGARHVMPTSTQACRGVSRELLQNLCSALGLSPTALCRESQPWSSAETGRVKPQARGQVNQCKCNRYWWQEVQGLYIRKGKISWLTAYLPGTGMDKLRWYPLQWFFRQPLPKRRWESEIKSSKYATAWHLKRCPLPFPAVFSLPSSPPEGVEGAVYEHADRRLRRTAVLLDELMYPQSMALHNPPPPNPTRQAIIAMEGLRATSCPFSLDLALAHW